MNNFLIICGIYEYCEYSVFVNSIICGSMNNSVFCGNGERMRGTGEDASERRSGPWYRLVFQPVLKEVIGTG